MHKNIRRIFLWDDKVGMRHVEGTDEKRICLWDAKIKTATVGHEENLSLGWQ
jgi:hypothetical protein